MNVFTKPDTVPCTVTVQFRTCQCVVSCSLRFTILPFNLYHPNSLFLRGTSVRKTRQKKVKKRNQAKR